MSVFFIIHHDAMPQAGSISSRCIRCNRNTIPPADCSESVGGIFFTYMNAMAFRSCMMSLGLMTLFDPPSEWITFGRFFTIVVFVMDDEHNTSAC